MTKELRDYLIETFYSNYVHPESITDQELEALHPKEVAAYKAGYEAGGPQWHDLRKDPNDLPDTDRKVWVKRECEMECQIDNYYDDEDGKGWGIMFREGYCTDDVIAWCELPIYIEEESE